MSSSPIQKLAKLPLDIQTAISLKNMGAFLEFTYSPCMNFDLQCISGYVGYVFTGVYDSIHRGGGRVCAWHWGHVWQRWQGTMHGGGYAWQGGLHGRWSCMAGETANAADGTHPTGMHSCLIILSLIDKHLLSEEPITLHTSW